MKEVNAQCGDMTIATSRRRGIVRLFYRIIIFVILISGVLMIGGIVLFIHIFGHGLLNGLRYLGESGK
jgi:hypothetical protein